MTQHRHQKIPLAPGLDLEALNAVDKMVFGVFLQIRRAWPSLLRNDPAVFAGWKAALLRGERAQYRESQGRTASVHGIGKELDRVREVAARFVGDGWAQHYLERLDELELDLGLATYVGNRKLIKTVAQRRYGRGDDLIEQIGKTVYEQALNISDQTNTGTATDGDSLLSADACLAAFQSAVRRNQLDFEVVLVPDLLPLAATSDRQIFLSGRPVTPLVLRRLLVHEVIGHAVSIHHALRQPLRLLEVGMARSLFDQEGLALWFEKKFGVLTDERLCLLAARVLASVMLHDGASFYDVVRRLWKERGFSLDESLVIAARVFRGGGFTKDLGYLRGFYQVSAALDAQTEALSWLRAGRTNLTFAVAPDALGSLLVKGPVDEPMAMI